MRVIDETVTFYKVLGCILVMIVHVTATYWTAFVSGSAQHMAIIGLNLIARFAVPAFIFINGYVMHLRYIDLEIHPMNYISRRLRTILLPYLMWSVFYTCYYHFIGIKAMSLSVFLDDLIYGSAAYHLYFMVLIIQFYVLFPILRFIFRTVNRPIMILTVVIILSIRLNSLMAFPYSDRFFFNYLVFYVLGMVMADLKISNWVIDKKKMLILTATQVVITVFYLLESGRSYLGKPRLIGNSYLYDWWVYSFVSVIFCYCLFSVISRYDLRRWTESVVDAIASVSFDVYLLHVLVMDILHRRIFYIRMQNASMTMAFIVEMFVVISLSITTALFIKAVRNLYRNRSVIASKGV